MKLYREVQKQTDTVLADQIAQAKWYEFARTMFENGWRHCPTLTSYLDTINADTVSPGEFFIVSTDEDYTPEYHLYSEYSFAEMRNLYAAGHTVIRISATIEDGCISPYQSLQFRNAMRYIDYFHAKYETDVTDFSTLLTTGLDSYFTANGWERICDEYDFSTFMTAPRISSFALIYFDEHPRMYQSNNYVLNDGVYVYVKGLIAQLYKNRHGMWAKPGHDYSASLLNAMSTVDAVYKYKPAV